MGKNLNCLQLLYSAAEISTIVVLLVYYSHAYARINELVKVRISQPQTMHYPSIKEKVLLPSQMASQQHPKLLYINSSLNYVYLCNLQNACLYSRHFFDLTSFLKLGQKSLKENSRSKQRHQKAISKLNDLYKI